MDRTVDHVAPDETWPADLKTGSEDAHQRLYGLLLRAARNEIHRKGNTRLAGVEADDLAHQAAADAMLAILAKLPLFRGESRFTTWAYGFVVLEVSAKLSRHTWTRHPTLPLDEERWNRIPERSNLSPEQEAERQDLLKAISQAIKHDLTPHQQSIFQAIVLNGTPPAALGENRNTIYKTLHDARHRLRAHLTATGHLPKPPPS